MTDDLHARLLVAVRQRMETATKATSGGPWRAVDMTIRGQTRMNLTDVLVVKHTWPQEAAHMIANDPATILRHCERDLKVLERHVDTGAEDPRDPGHCRGCHADFREEWAERWPCPEITDLAAAYGVTADE